MPVQTPQQLQNATNPQPLNVGVPGDGVYSSGQNGQILIKTGNTLYQTGLDDLGRRYASTLGQDKFNQANGSNAVAADYGNQYLTSLGLNYGTLGKVGESQMADLLGNAGKLGLNFSNNFDLNSLSGLLKTPTTTGTTATLNNTGPNLPASPQVIADNQQVQQQQLAGLQGQNVTTQTNPQGNIVSSSTQPLGAPNPNQTGANAFQSTQQNPNAIPMSGGYVAQTMSPLDVMKQQLMAASQQLTAMGAPPQNVSDKYNALFNDKKGSESPSTNPRQDIATYFNATAAKDPVQDFMDRYTAMNPAERGFFDAVQAILSPLNTKTSLVEEYNKLLTESGVQGLKTELMNVNRIMEGTEDDLRAEITKAGGFATESQVQALTAARNKTFLKQAAQLTDQIALKEDYINQIIQLTGQDRAAVERDVDRKLGIAETMTNLQIKMEEGARSNLNNIIQEGGFKGLAEMYAGNPTAMRMAERTLGLPSGALSNKTFLDLMTQDDKKYQFISGTANQQSGVFDPATGTFKATGGGGPAAGGTGGVLGGGAVGDPNKAYYDAFANVTQGVGPQTIPTYQKQFNSYMQSGDLEGARNYLLGLALERNPAADKTIIVGRQAAFDQMSEIKGLLDAYVAKSGDTNILKGTVENAAQKIGQSSNPDLAYLGSRLTQALINYRRAMSGVAFSEAESKQYASIMPDYSNAGVLNAAMIDAFQDTIRLNQRASMAFYMGGTKVFDALYGNPYTSQLPSDKTPIYNNQILISRNGVKGYIPSLSEWNPDTDKFMSVKPN